MNPSNAQNGKAASPAQMDEFHRYRRYNRERGRRIAAYRQGNESRGQRDLRLLEEDEDRASMETPDDGR